MIKKFIFPVIFAVLAFILTPRLGPEVNGATTFFLVALGVGLGIMLNIFLFKKPSKNDNKSN